MNVYSLLCGILTFSMFLCSSGTAQQLTADQQQDLLKTGKAFSEKGRMIQTVLNNKLNELMTELKREGRLDTEASAKEGSEKVTVLLKEISALYDDLIQNKVDHFLASKNLLTDAQRQHLLYKLRPQELVPEEKVMIIEPDIFDLPLNLDREQQKEMVKLRAELLIRKIELERDVELVLMDMEDLMKAGRPQPDKFDPLAKKLGKLAAQELDNRVNFIIKAKDILTLNQRQLQLFLLELD